MVTGDLTDLEQWVHATSIGLAQIGGTPDAASRNLVLLLRKVLGRAWFSPERLPMVLKGIRGALNDVPGTPDPLQATLTAIYSEMVTVMVTVRRRSHWSR